MLSAWLPAILFAAVIVIGIPLWCWFAADDDPGNEISQEQEREPRRSAEMILAA